MKRVQSVKRSKKSDAKRKRWQLDIDWRRTKFELLEDRAMLSVAQDIVNDITPYQNALSSAINAVTSLPLIGTQLKGLQQFNTILQDSLQSIESQTQNLSDGHFQLAIPLPSISHTFTFNLGLDAFLQVQTSGGVAGSITPTLNVGFDYEDGSVSLDLANTDLDVGFGLTLPNFQATMSLNGFLYTHAVDAGTDFEGHLAFGFDNDGSITPQFSGDAHILLGLTMSFVDPSQNAPFNPTFKSTLDIDWGFNSQTNELKAPEIKLDNFGLDADSFLHGFLGDLVTEVQKFTEPLQPIVNVLNTPVPILSAFDSDETIGDLLLKGAGGTDADELDKFNTLMQVITSVDSIDLSGTTGGAVINFGTISLTGDARNAGGFNFDTSQLGSAMDQIFNSPVFETIKNDLTQVAAYAGLTSTAGLQFPLLEDPAPVIAGILTGQTQTMFSFSTGRIHFDLSPSVGVGIKDILGIFLSAGISFDADLTMGYDTAGLTKFLADPNKNPVDLLHGFYFDNSIDTTDAPIPNVPHPRDTGVYLQGLMELSASAVVTLSGGLYANLQFELANNDTSSHVYLDTMINDLASRTKVFNASGELYAAAAIRLVLPDPIGPDITLFKYELGHFDLINENPPPPPSETVPVVVIDVADQHTLELDSSKMTSGSVISVQPFYNYPVTSGNYVADGIRVDYPNEIDLYVERKGGTTTDYYNLIGVNGTVPDDTAIDISDPFRVFKDDGVPDPSPAQTKPGVLLVGGSSTVYTYGEAADGSRANVLLVGGYGSNTLTGGTMEFGNFIPADRIQQAKDQFGDESGFDATGQALIGSTVDSAIEPPDPNGIIGATMTASRGGLMYGGLGANSFIANGPGAYQMIGGPWVDVFNISPSFQGVPATYTIDGGPGGGNSLVVRVPSGDMADFEDGMNPDPYDSTTVELDIFSNAGLFAIAVGIQNVSVQSQVGSTVVIGDTSELNINFTLAGEGQITFGGSAGPDQFNVSTVYNYQNFPDYYATARRRLLSVLFPINTADGQANGVEDLATLDGIVVVPPGQTAPPASDGHEVIGSSSNYEVDPPIVTVARTFGTTGKSQSINLEADDPLNLSVTLDGRGGSDNYQIQTGLGSFFDIHVKDSDTTTRNTLTVTPNNRDLEYYQATITDDALAIQAYTPLELITFPLVGPADTPEAHYYLASATYTPTISFSSNVDPTLAGASLFENLVVDRPDAAPDQTLTLQLDGGIQEDSDFMRVPWAYDPTQPDAKSVPLNFNGPRIYDVVANSANLAFSENTYLETRTIFNIQANQGQISLLLSHSWDGDGDTVNIYSNEGTITDHDNIGGTYLGVAAITGLDNVLNVFGNSGTINQQTTVWTGLTNTGIDTQVNVGASSSLADITGTISLSNTNGHYGLTVDDSQGDDPNWTINASSTVIGNLTINYPRVNAPSVNADTFSDYVAKPTESASVTLGTAPPFYTFNLSFLWNLVVSSSMNDNDGDYVYLSSYITGTPGGTVTYSATNLPPGLSIDPTTGLISGKILPLSYLNSDYQVAVTAHVGNTSRTATIDWTVYSGIQLFLPDSWSAHFKEGQGLGPGEIQAYDAFNLPYTIAVTGLPPGLSFDPTTRSVTGTIAVGAAQNSPYHVVVHATDGTETADTELDLNVTGITLSPVANQLTLVGTPVQLAVAASTYDGSPVTYSALGLPDGLSIDPQTGLISGVPTAQAAAQLRFNPTIVATDGNDQQETTFTWGVLPIGVSDYIAVDKFGIVTYQAGETVALALNPKSSLGLPLSVSATGLPPGLSVVDDSGDYFIAGTIDAGALSGAPYHVHMVATDGISTGEGDFTWNIDASSSVLFNPPGPEHSNVGDYIDTFFMAYSSFGQKITYSLTGLPPGLTSFSNGLVAGTIGQVPASPDPFEVTITATTASGTDTRNFLWYVSNQPQGTNSATLPNPSGGTFTITSPNNTTLSASISPTSGVTPPSGVSFPFGFLTFEIDNLQPGQAADVVISGLNTTTINSYYKYGATPANPTPHWYNFLSGEATDSDDASITGMEIVDGNIVLHLVDSARGDDDISKNGAIFDIGGPAIGSVQTSASTQTAVGSDHTAGSTYGQSVLFTATVSSASGTPTGTVQFQVDGHNVGTPQTLVNGQASLDTTALSAGDDTVKALFSSDSDQFAGSSGNLEQLVAQAPLTITADGKSKSLGSANPTLTYTPSGFVNGDTSASLTTQPTVSTTATTNSPIGSYSLTASGAVDSNYTISYVAGTLAITGTPPEVTGLFVTGSSWNSAFKTSLVNNSLGNATYGYALQTGSSQLSTLPWTNINTIEVQFNEPVNVGQGSLELSGGTGGSTPSVTGFSSLGNNVYAWTLSGPLTDNRYLIALPAAGVTDSEGDTLDGEWATSTSTLPSGDGNPGGDFNFSFNVLPGDVNQTAPVDANDYNMVISRLGDTTGSTAYTPYFDVDGNGLINANDYNAVRAHLGSMLPSNSPLPQTFQVSGLQTDDRAVQGMALAAQEGTTTSTGGTSTSIATVSSLSNAVAAPLGSSTTHTASSHSGHHEVWHTGSHDTSIAKRASESHREQATDNAVADFELADLWA
jgi:MBG domain (YGX type)/Bacterial Ig-like domain (group 3)/Putative Ig domain/Dockerin type I domain